MVRLVSVIGHGVNLLNHFIDHYKNYVDEMHFVIYETEKYPLLANEVKEIIEKEIRKYRQLSKNWYPGEKAPFLKAS
mgnify:CR=1 FL=1